MGEEDIKKETVYYKTLIQMFGLQSIVYNVALFVINIILLVLIINHKLPFMITILNMLVLAFIFALFSINKKYITSIVQNNKIVISNIEHKLKIIDITLPLITMLEIIIIKIYV